MTVKELITKLLEFDMDKKVLGYDARLKMIENISSVKKTEGDSDALIVLEYYKGQYEQ